MRVIGFVGVLALSAAFVHAQQPGLPPAAPPAAPTADPVLDGHLENWSKTLAKASNFSAKFDLARTESTFKKQRDYTGQVLIMKPNLARISIGSVADKGDFEAYICNGKSLFEYNWKAKSITEIPIAQGQGDNLMVDFLGGMTAAAAKKRFHIKQFNPTDKNYVYFDIKPTLPKDQQEFEHIRFALYAPTVQAPHKPYMPAQMYMLKPSGDTEMWVFKDQAVDVPGIAEKHFQYEAPADPKNWNFKKVTPPPAGGAIPAGGAVRPGPMK
jgi:TIGR03009 family protein